MLRLLCLGLISLAGLVSFNLADDTFIPMKVLYAAVPFFPTVDFCNRICYSAYQMLENNVRFVTFWGALNPGETPEALGNCIAIYINQTGWLSGATTQITSANGNAALEITGIPDPSYDPNAGPDETFDTPLELTGEIFNAFPNADLAGCKCVLSSKKDPCGCVHCRAKCVKVEGDDRTSEEVLEEAYDYFNQVQLVNRCTRASREDDSYYYLEFVGNYIPGEDGQTCTVDPDTDFD